MQTQIPEKNVKNAPVPNLTKDIAGTPNKKLEVADTKPEAVSTKPADKPYDKNADKQNDKKADKPYDKKADKPFADKPIDLNMEVAPPAPLEVQKAPAAAPHVAVKLETTLPNTNQKGFDKSAPAVPKAAEKSAQRH